MKLGEICQVREPLLKLKTAFLQMTQNGFISKAIIKQFKDLQWSNIGL